MELEKTKRVNDLIDLYGSLLTEKQLNVITLYYMEDLSLKEIADELEVSRNAVFDSIKRSIEMLEKFEKKLKLIDKDERKKELLENLEKYSKEEIKERIINL